MQVKSSTLYQSLTWYTEKYFTVLHPRQDPFKCWENKLEEIVVYAAHIDVDFAAFVLAGIVTSHVVELEAIL